MGLFDEQRADGHVRVGKVLASLYDLVAEIHQLVVVNRKKMTSLWRSFIRSNESRLSLSFIFGLKFELSFFLMDSTAPL